MDITCPYCGLTFPDRMFVDKKGRLRKRCFSCREENANMSPEKRILRQQERARVRAREWAKKNPDKKKAHARQYAKRARQRDPEKLRARFQRWREANADKARLAYRRWSKTHPEATKTRDFLRRTRVVGAGKLSAVALRALRAEVACTYCAEMFGDTGTRTRTVDHVHPLARGGTNETNNLVACCALCNSKKGTKLLSEWVATGAAPDGAKNFLVRMDTCQGRG